MRKPYRTTDDQFTEACTVFWSTYYESMQELHARRERLPHQPLKDRNLGTTAAKHIIGFETFWSRQLAGALKVDPSEVGPRKIKFREHRSKKFDVCWPRQGEPKILISIKSMQNAYRNFTNRIEEALGDSAILRLYEVPAVFGFFFFMLDGKVARGNSEQGKPAPGHKKSGKGKGVAPYLDLIEEGGDFFQLTHLDAHRKGGTTKGKGRQNVISSAELSLIDLLAKEQTKEADLHYDAIAFAPTTITRLRKNPRPTDWSFQFSAVDQRLDFRSFIRRMVEVARLRGFV